MSFRREYYLEIFAKHQGIVEVTCFYLGNKYVLRIYYLSMPDTGIGMKL